MANYLLKQSLEIVEGGLEEQKKHRKGNKFANQESVLDLMPQKHKLVTKFKTKGKKFQIDQIQKERKLTLMEAKKAIQENANKQEKNLEKLLRLSSNPIDIATAEKVVSGIHRRRLDAVKDTETNKNEESVFTPEDFEAFEKEYFADENA